MIDADPIERYGVAELTIRARDLRPGDYLIGSSRTVTYRGQVMNGHLRVDSRRGGRHFSARWNASTTLRIRREI